MGASRLGLGASAVGYYEMESCLHLRGGAKWYGMIDVWYMWGGLDSPNQWAIGGRLI